MTRQASQQENFLVEQLHYLLGFLSSQLLDILENIPADKLEG